MRRNGVESCALSSMRVLDLSEGIAGAYCTKLLVDAGADCVKVEAPGGDPLRGWSATGAPSGPRGSALFRFLHASGRSLVADLAAAADRSVVQGLASRADLVVTSAAPGTLDALGLGYELLARRNPSLVVVAISSYGQGGPDSRRAATEFTLQAECGSTGFRAFPEDPPLAAGGRLGEWIAGTYAAIAALALVTDAWHSGHGDLVDLSMLECMAVTYNVFEPLHAALSEEPDRFAAEFDRTYEVPAIEPAADGWVGLTLLTPEQWARFARLVGRPDLADDPALGRMLGRWPRRAEVREIVRAWTSARTVAEILDLAGEHRIPAAPVGDGASLPGFEHLAARGVFVEHPGGDFLQPRVPYRVSTAPPRSVGPAPALGDLEADAALAAWPARDRRMPEHAPELPCAGLRVVDFSAIWAGPLVTWLLGVLGADVVRVESVGRPDPIRFAAARDPGTDRWWETSWLFHGTNSGKRAVTVDLHDPAGLDLAWRLVERADVVVENMTPRVFDGLGITAEAVARRNPRAVFVRMPAFGLDGPWRDRGGFAQTMEQLCGLASVTGFADGPPTMPRGPCDPLAGLHACFATLVALQQRARSGRGALVEAVMIEAALNVAAEVVVEHSATGRQVPRCGNRSPVVAPQGVYECADGRWLAVAVETVGQWHALGGWLRRPEWAREGPLDDLDRRRGAHDRIDRALADRCRTGGADRLEAELAGAGVPAAVVITPPYVDRHPQLRARRFFEPIAHPVVGTIGYPAPPFRLATRPGSWLSSPAPCLGEHNDAVLIGELGCTAAELAAWRAGDLVGEVPVAARTGPARDGRALRGG